MVVLRALVVATGLLIVTVPTPAMAQPSRQASHDSSAKSEHDGTDGMCIPVAERAGRKYGCFVLASVRLGHLPATQLYWYLDRYATRADAEKERGARSTVVESYGTAWVLSIADKDFRAPAGRRVARVGPLPLKPVESVTAFYMEATFKPGMKSAIHRHAGPEAWYVLAGKQCLETPDGKVVIQAGETGIVPEGPPMMLSATGTAERRSLVLILGDSSAPIGTPAADWTPKGLCSAP